MFPDPACPIAECVQPAGASILAFGAKIGFEIGFPNGMIIDIA